MIWRVIPSLLAGDELMVYTVERDENGLYHYVNRWVPAEPLIDRAGFKSALPANNP